MVNTKLVALSTDSKLRAERMNYLNHNSVWSHIFFSLPSIACRPIHAGKSKIFAKFMTSESEQAGSTYAPIILLYLSIHYLFRKRWLSCDTAV